MTQKRLVTLSIAALIAISAGVWLAGRQGSLGRDDSQHMLYPQLKQQLGSVDSVSIFRAGDERAVQITRGESGWGVAERAGYPADEARLGKFLRALADAKLYEEKTANPENYPSLGVQDVGDPQADGVRVEIGGVDPAINLIVGKPGPGAQSRYVRRVQEAQSWLVNANIDAAASPDAWLRKQILDISADRVQSARVSTAGGKPYTAAKDSRTAADFAVTGLPKGKKLSYESAANSFATALASLTLTDVKPATEFEGRKPTAQATFTTFDGLVVDLDGWSEGDRRFIALKSSFDPELAERFRLATTAAASDAEGEGQSAQPQDEAKKTKEPDVAEEAAKASAQLAGWVYQIPSYKYEQIFKPLDDLVE